MYAAHVLCEAVAVGVGGGMRHLVIIRSAAARAAVC